MNISEQYLWEVKPQIYVHQPQIHLLGGIEMIPDFGVKLIQISASVWKLHQSIILSRLR